MSYLEYHHRHDITEASRGTLRVILLSRDQRALVSNAVSRTHAQTPSQSSSRPHHHPFVFH